MRMKGLRGGQKMRHRFSMPQAKLDNYLRARMPMLQNSKYLLKGT